MTALRPTGPLVARTSNDCLGATYDGPTADAERPVSSRKRPFAGASSCDRLAPRAVVRPIPDRAGVRSKRSFCYEDAGPTPKLVISVR